MDSISKVVDAAMGAVGRELQTETETFVVDEPVDAITVEVDSGSVSVRPAEAGERSITVTRTISYHTKRPEASHDVADGRLTLRAHTTATVRTERVDHEVVAPAGTRLDLRPKVGSIRVTGMAGAIDARSAVGSVDIDHATGPVSVDCTTGAVRLDDLTGDVDVRTSAGSVRAGQLNAARVRASSDTGSVRIVFDTAPTSVDVRTNVGSITVELPEDDYAFDTEAVLGSARVDGLEHVEDAARSVRARTDVGSITIRPRGAAVARRQP